MTQCPEGVVMRDGDGYRVEYLYCAGCGTCATECPRGVIYMAEDIGPVVDLPLASFPQSAAGDAPRR